MKRNRWTTRLACGFLVTAATLGAALAAGTQGSQSDPLVTLSYLNEKVTPDILKQVDEHIEKQVSELEKLVREGETKAVFVPVEAESGKVLTLTPGTQLVLRSGKAEGDGLLDSTAGEMATGPLTANHLYIAMGESQKITLTEKAALLILGEYTLS